jgi:hypothetical protein
MSQPPDRVWAAWSSLLSSAAREGQAKFTPAPLRPLPRAMWHVVSFGEVNEPIVTPLETQAELLVHLGTLAKDMHVTIFFGVQGSHGQAADSPDRRYFFPPDGGEPLPLYDPSAPVVEHVHGYMGEPPADLTPEMIAALGDMRAAAGNAAPVIFGTEGPIAEDSLEDFDPEVAAADDDGVGNEF